MGGIMSGFAGRAILPRPDSPVPIAPKAVQEKVDSVTPSALLTRRLPQSTAESPGVGLLTQPGKTLGGS